MQDLAGPIHPGLLLRHRQYSDSICHQRLRGTLLDPVTSIISSLIGGLIKLPHAKLIDIWGRPQGLCLMIASVVVGLIMMAGCNNVKTYCAAQIFYTVVYNGIDFTMTIFIADTSSLQNRAFMIAFAASPWIAVNYAYGPAAQSILKTIGFRWGFGIWWIVLGRAISRVQWLRLGRKPSASRPYVYEELRMT